ncbi:MAG: hypothetical protein RLN88_07880 [Ekhidna sp.]|uniref:hypothetical protein n=1 Tax=Ekhidna sp. TaxID=2608089 RepID=UPI0032EB85EB
MPGRLSIVTIILSVLSCAEADVSAKLYDYQVERLLSGQLGSKTWNQIVDSENCADSIKLFIELVNSSGDADDSLDISELTPISNCTSFDTVYLGRADASSFSGGDLFTDSLIFASGDFWIVSQITSTFFTTEESNIQSNYQSF